MSSRLIVSAPLSTSLPDSSEGPDGRIREVTPSRRGVALPIVLACGAVLILYARSLTAPVLFYDDFQILTQSWTWERTREGLWVPQNEHAMPLGRLFCFVLECVAGRLPVLPFLTVLVGPVALLVGMLLVYVFVRRELGHPLYGVLALVLFGVTTVYHTVIWWFAASFAVLALDTMLLGLLAAQRWRQTGRTFYLDLTVLACLLAPGWFAIGVLAGPLCCLYLMQNAECRMQNEKHRSSILHSAFCILHSRLTLLPLLGTALFLAMSLPRTGDAILHTSHYGEQTAVEAFRPLVGLGFTARSIVDNLLLGLVGIANVQTPLVIVCAVWAAIIAVGFWWWRQAPDRRLMLLGLGLIGSSYLLVYSARAAWGYEVMTEPIWARYHLLPHLGLVLFFCGGLPGRAGRWFALNGDASLNSRQRRLVGVLIGVCLLVHLPRGVICGSPTGWEPIGTVQAQQAALRRIEEVDTRCRAHHISAAAARQALKRLDVPCSLDVIDGWEFLRGSDDPRPLPPEDVKRLLDVP